MLQVGKPVTGHNLIGRQEEITQLLTLLQAGQSIVIIAPRRMGKTSVVLELLNQFKAKDCFTCYTDIFSVSDIPALATKITESVLSNKKFDSIFRKAIKDVSEFFQNVQFTQEIEDYKFILNFKDKAKENKWELLEDCIDFIEDYSIKHNKQTIVAFDEFGDIKKLDGTEIVKLFRSKLQLHQHVSYLFSGSYESVMNELFITKDAPFFRMARVIDLGNIDEKVFTDYLSELFTKEGLKVEEQRLQQIVHFTKGHPYYTQLYAQELIIKHKLGEKQLSHEKILNSLLIAEQNYLEKSWEELSASKEMKKIIITLIHSPQKLYSVLSERDINIPRGLKRLSGMGVIKKENKAYHLTDPLLKLWIERNIV
jgi:AAA+ ATPase superfamily predicted ATPase